METLEELRARRRKMESDLARDIRWRRFWGAVMLGLLVLAVVIAVLGIVGGITGAIPWNHC